MAKMPPQLAEQLVEMHAIIHGGAPLQNFHTSKPRLGKVKLRDFAEEFAAVYNKKYGRANEGEA